MTTRVHIKVCIILIMMGIITLFLLISHYSATKTLIIGMQQSDEVLYKEEVKPGDVITFSWIHSFEHIPWIEEYSVQQDNTFLLDTIKVAGFGAGIPEDKGEISFEDDMVVMRHIEEPFSHFAWIHSQTALTSIALNGKVLITGTELPHHQRLQMTIQGR